MDRNQQAPRSIRAVNRYFSVGLIGFTFLVASCGDEEGRNTSRREFGQGVDLIHYRLESVSVNIELEQTDHSVERITRNLDLRAGSTKDEIQRVINGSSFKLVVNGEEAAVEVSSQENIDHHKETPESSPACRMLGRSDVTGRSSSLDLDLNWNLQVSVDGVSCDEYRTKMKNFIEAELARFHMKSVTDLLASADLKSDRRQRISIQLQIRGTSE